MIIFIDKSGIKRMKKLLVYLKDYKKECVLGPLFKMLEATFELIVPFIIASLIDNGIKASNGTHIIKMGIILISFAVIGLVCALTAQYYAARAAVGFSAKVKEALFGKIQSLSFGDIDIMGTSTLITRMTSDINQVQTGVNLTIRLFLRSPFIVFGAMIMAFLIDVKSAVWFAVVIPVLSLVVFGIMLLSIPLYKRVQSALDLVLKTTRQNLTGVRVIRAFNKQQDEVESFVEKNSNLTQIQNFVGRISALLNPLTYVIINAALIALIYTGALRVDNGNITNGEVVALVNLMSQILIELIKLANLIITMTKAVACGNRIENILDSDVSMVSGCEKNAFFDCAKVSFENVYLKYKNAGEESLSDISLSVKAGEKVGVIGGTGSGKTSLVNMIPRFYDADSGIVSVDGLDVRKYDLDTLRQKFGIVMQKTLLFKGSVRDNLRWGNENATDEELWDALRLAQADTFIKEKDGMLDYKINQGGSNLSGGQKQRLSIARALVRKPEILILDDSSSALDYATEASLRASIFGLDYNPTIFIVSQRASSVMHADKIVVLEDGHIVGIGKHEDLISKCDVYNEIYYSQFEREASCQ